MEGSTNFLTECFAPAAYPGFGDAEKEVFCRLLALSSSVRETNMHLKDFWDFLVYRESKGVFEDFRGKLEAKLSYGKSEGPMVIDLS